MSSRRVRASRTINEEDDEINDLLLKLQAALPPPESSSRCTSRVPAATSNILKETCSYIRKLHREVDGLSERLSQLLAAMDS
ncbi:hypothetical protein U1Q18_049984, partial [Sarracenia purpurea var. burkii]